MEPPDGVRRAGALRPQSVRLVRSADDMSDFDAALDRLEKLLRLNEGRLELLLEGLTELNRDMDRAAAVWGVGR